MNTTTHNTLTSPAIDVGTGLREGYAEVGDVKLHYVEAGDGPLVVLLHGFPEFWYGWREQIAPLVKAGFRVVAPDLRGYNLSSKPGEFTDYTADKPAADIRGLIRELGCESATVVGHDWGGSVAWTLAMNSPEVVDRLVILNAAHPRKLNEGLKNPRQLLRSWYFFYFQFPGLPGASCGPRQLEVLQGLPARRPPAVHAAGARSLHRGVVPAGGGQGRSSTTTARRSGWGRSRRSCPSRRPPWSSGVRATATSVPTLAEPHQEDVPNLDRVERLPNASHWVHHDEAERVNELLVDFLAPVRASQNGR